MWLENEWSEAPVPDVIRARKETKKLQIAYMKRMREEIQAIQNEIDLPNLREESKYTTLEGFRAP